jgi:hypothetical protein
MTDLLDVDERLRRAGEAFRDQPLAEVAIRWPSATRRSRFAVPVTIAAAIALVIAGVAIGLNVRHESAPASPIKPAPPIPASPDPIFAVAPPPNNQLGHGVDDRTIERGCALNTLHLAATTQATQEGVVGLITLTDHDCSITTDPASIRLLDAAGHPLGVPVVKGNSVNAPQVLNNYNFGSPTTRIKTDLSGPRVVDTTARIGYAWVGTYCGTPPASLAINIGGHILRAPINGPAPACRPHATSRLIPGTLAGLGGPVVPAPIAWKALRARLVLPPTFAPGPIPVVVVLTNTGSTTVALSDPCPTAMSFVTLHSSNWNAGFGGPNGELCDRPRVLAPGASTTLSMPSLAFPSTKNFPQLNVQSGDLLTVTWSISGVPTATATTRIR